MNERNTNINHNHPDILSPTPSLNQLFRYSLLAVTIAFGGLPIYIHLPKLYADQYHINLATLGLILMILRITDAFTDPILGPLSDKWQQHRLKILWTGSIVFAIAFNGLFYAPTDTVRPIVWFTIVTFFVYLGYSLLVINYYAVGLLLASDYQQRTRVSAIRESLSLMGIIVASVLPELLMTQHDPLIAFRYYGLIFLTIAIGACVCLPSLPSVPSVISSARLGKDINPKFSYRLIWQVIKNNSHLKWIFCIVFLNNLPTAFTSNLFLFYISDVLKRPHQAGYFLITYFMVAAGSSILWLSISRSIGKRRTLMIGIIFSIASGLCTYHLTASTSEWFYLMCVLSGLALGADSIILPSLFADIIDDHKAMGGSFFSIWQALIKVTLAIGAGTSLPFLSFIGYVPGQTSTEATAGDIGLAYALLPCIIKAIVLLILSISPLDSKADRAIIDS